MEPTRASETAIDTALVRALDAELLIPPVFGDSVAAMMLKRAEREAREAEELETVKRQSPELALGSREDLLRIVLQRHASVTSLVLSRARYAEQKLAEAMTKGVSQYVMIGAGLDTFALRRPDLQDRLAVFELDHPLSQLDKRSRLRAAGLAVPPNLHFGACNLEAESIDVALRAIPFDPNKPAFFAWLGVTMYLTRQAFEGTLRSLHGYAAPGSDLVFDYLDAQAMRAHGEEEGLRSNVDRVNKVGEPVLGAMDSDSLRGDLSRLGYEVIEDLGPDALESLYFSTRSDDLRASEVGRIAYARKLASS